MAENGKTIRDPSNTITEGRTYYTGLDNPAYDIDDVTGEITPTGDIDESTKIDLIGFKENTYYIKENDNTYTLLTSLANYK
jgi:hypothetical protein